jgi:hypothetical protein
MTCVEEAAPRSLSHAEEESLKIRTDWITLLERI